MVRLQVRWVALDDDNRSVAILREGPGAGDWSPRVLLVPIEREHAKAIARALREGGSPRPSTHELLADTVESLGGRIVRVTLRSSDDASKTDPPGASRRRPSLKGIAREYRAEVHLECDGEVRRFAAPVGDALALALMADAPITVPWELAERRTVLLQEDDSGELDRFRRLMRGMEAG